MPQLSKKRKYAPKLLRTVNDKPHADENDHEPCEKPTSGPQFDKEDIYAEPKDSSDEESQAPEGRTSMGAKKQSSARKSRADIETTNWLMNAPNDDVFKDFADRNKTYARNIHTASEPSRKKSKNRHTTYSIRSKLSINLYCYSLRLTAIR